MMADDFYYNGYYLSDFGFVMAAPDTDDTSGLTRELLKGEMNPHRPDANHYGAQYSEPLVLNFLVFKGNCEDTEYRVSYRKMRDFQSWITSLTVPSPLLAEFTNGEPTEYMGVFTDIQPVVKSGVNGFELTFTCNSPFGYQHGGLTAEITNEESVTKAVWCDSDENNYVYPILTITDFGSGTFTIINDADSSQTMSLSLDDSYETYVIDCKLRRILADDTVLTLSDVGWNMESISDYNNVNTGIYKAYWLRLLPGMNNLTITGQVNVQLDFKYPVKIGGFIDVRV